MKRPPPLGNQTRREFAILFEGHHQAIPRRPTACGPRQPGPLTLPWRQYPGGSLSQCAGRAPRASVSRLPRGTQGTLPARALRCPCIHGIPDSFRSIRAPSTASAAAPAAPAAAPPAVPAAASSAPSADCRRTDSADTVVDAPLQRQSLQRGRPRTVLERRPTNAQQAVLKAQSRCSRRASYQPRAGFSLMIEGRVQKTSFPHQPADLRIRGPEPLPPNAAHKPSRPPA